MPRSGGGGGRKRPPYTSGCGPAGMRAGVTNALQHQIMKADESTALAHMAILFRVQIIQSF